MNALRNRALPFLALLSMEFAFATCEFETTDSVQSGDYTFSVTTYPSRVSVGEHFTLYLQICEKGNPLIGDIGIDAIMPAHRHGMNYAPTVARVGPGRFTAQGMFLHMPGHWRLIIDLRVIDKAPLVYDFNL